jgi:hypothetical protein
MHFEVLLSRAARVLFSSKWEGIRLQDTHSPSTAFIRCNRYPVATFAPPLGIAVQDEAPPVAALRDMMWDIHCDHSIESAHDRHDNSSYFAMLKLRTSAPGRICADAAQCAPGERANSTLQRTESRRDDTTCSPALQCRVGLGFMGRVP